MQEINLKSLHNTVGAFIRSQEDPKSPKGTIINTNSGLAGMLHPSNSAYSISKMAANRYMEYVHLGEWKSIPVPRTMLIISTQITPVSELSLYCLVSSRPICCTMDMTNMHKTSQS